MKDIKQLFILPFLIGIIGGFSAIFIRIIIDLSTTLYKSVNFFDSHNEFYFISIPAAFVTSALIIQKFLQGTKNPTIDSVAKTIILKKGQLDYKKGIAGVILTAINIGFGTPVGREGPIAKLGGSLTSLFLKPLHIEGVDKPLLVSCGVSSAIAATFNAPIAAVVFGLEIILGRLNFSAIAPLAISSATATIISRHFLGNYPTFFVHSLSYNYIFLLLTPIFSISFALLIFLYSKIQKNLFIFDVKAKLTLPIKALIGGFIVASIVYAFPDTASLGYSQITKLFAGGYSFRDAFFISISKLIALAITFGSGMFGGVFAPATFIGSFFGFFLGGLFENFTSIDPLSVALIGAAALTAGISNAPFRSTLIIVELTQNYQMVVPIMLSTSFTVYFYNLLEKKVHFSRTLLQKGFNISDNAYRNKLKKMGITNLIETDIPIIDKNDKIQAIMYDIMKSSSNYFPVVEQDKLIGIVSFRDLRLISTEKMYLDTKVEKIMTQNPSFLTLDSNGLDVFEFVSKLDAGYIPVVKNKDDKTYMGMLNINGFNKLASFMYFNKENVSLFKS